MAVRAQCASSLPFDWRDDPPQEVRALQDLLHNALPLILLPYACQMPTVTFPQQRQTLSGDSSVQVFQLQRCRRLVQQAFCLHLLAVLRSHILFSNTFPPSKPTVLTILHRSPLTSDFFPFCLPQVVTVLTEVCVRLSVALHQHRCDSQKLEASLPALPVAHGLGLVPFSRVAHRTWNKPHLLLVLVHAHIHVVLLARFVFLCFH